MSNINKPLYYIRKNRKDEAIIYLKEDDQKAAQRLLCYMWATEHNVDILCETTNIEEVKNCNVMLVASATMLTRDVNKYRKSERRLKKEGIRIEIVVDETNEKEYIERALGLFKKV